MYQILSNDKGYTLLSLLFSLSILFIISPLTIYLIKPINDLNQAHYYPYYEMNQFKFFIQNELNQSENIELNQNKIHFHRADKTTVTIEIYNDQIRRRVNHSGHEILIRNVQQFDVNRINDYYFEITITRGDGYEQKQYYYFKNKSR